MQKVPAEFAALVGIDWADRKHDVCLHVPGDERFEHSVVEHRAAAIDAWASGLRERFGGAPIAVCLELSQGPIVSALLEYDFFVIFPISPATLAKYRRAFTPSRAKDDSTDARLAVDLFLRHRERFSALRRESEGMRALRRLVEARRDLVQDRVRVTNRLTHVLKEYFPQVLGWFRDKWADVFVDFVTRWPTLQAAQRAREETLVAFFNAHNVCRVDTVQRRLEAIKTERPLTDDRAIVEPALLQVKAFLGQLRELRGRASIR